MKSLVDHLSQYAAYHRDPHNIATHFVGIPLIVIAVATLLSRPQWAGISPAVLVMLTSAVFYLRLELRLGVLMTVLLGLSVWLGHTLAALSTAAWLGWGIGLFVVGWVDRKSTRELQSRCEISYAVFCLKKIFFFNDTATTEIYTLSPHDALPICDDFTCNA